MKTSETFKISEGKATLTIVTTKHDNLIGVSESRSYNGDNYELTLHSCKEMKQYKGVKKVVYKQY